MNEKFSKGMIGVYQFKVLLTGECFVGSSASLPNRFRNNLKLLINQSHPQKSLQKSWNEYGSHNVVFSILEIVQNRYELPQRELFWIQELQATEIDGEPLDRLHTPHSPGGHISVQKEVRDSVRAIGRGTMVASLQWLIEYYEKHAKT